MGSNVKRIVIQPLYIIFLAVALSIARWTHAECVDLNFDETFCVSWYQKGLVPIMRAWYIITQAVEAKDGLPLFDIIIEKVAFAQFCIEQMYKETCVIDNDDISYLLMVVRKIELLLVMIKPELAIADQVDCILSILLKTEKMLELLYVPSHV